ncbi:NifU family protein [Halanaerobaculum tunisiense]
MDLAEVQEFLDENVRPKLASHNGDIKAVKLEEGRLEVKLLGACSQCPAAQLTMEEVVIDSLQEEFPDLTDIKAIEGVSDELISDAKEILSRRRKNRKGIT